MGKVGIRALAISRLRNHYRLSVLRLQRRLSHGDQSDTSGGFFDSFPRFYSTSTSGFRNRLNKRYRAIIEANHSIIKNCSVLDIASHDGRWSLAANKAGARHVLGIEAREHLVEYARAAMGEYGISNDEVQFVLGDVFEQLDRLEPEKFDTVFCLGFFYHTVHHMLLLNKIARLRPKHIIMDTCIDLDPDNLVVLQREKVADETAGMVPDAGDQAHILVGTPTKSALDLMLFSAGFTTKYYDWHQAGIRCWDNLVEYHEGLRVSLVATRNEN